MPPVFPSYLRHSSSPPMEVRCIIQEQEHQQAKMVGATLSILLSQHVGLINLADGNCMVCWAVAASSRPSGPDWNSWGIYLYGLRSYQVLRFSTVQVAIVGLPSQSNKLNKSSLYHLYSTNTVPLESRVGEIANRYLFLVCLRLCASCMHCFSSPTTKPGEGSPALSHVAAPFAEKMPLPLCSHSYPVPCLTVLSRTLLY